MSTILTQSGVALERVHYFPRQLITADDMTAEQEYFRQKLRRHNRFLHGWGGVCGLEVTAAAIPEEPGRVRIDAGYALSPQGDEIYVPEPVCIDLAKCGIQTVADPCEPGQTTTVHPSNDAIRLFIAIKYIECRTRPVRVHPAGCGCDETGCEYTRIRDDYKIECLLELPASHRPQRGLGICDLVQKGRIPPCPPCPDEPWVVLAAVHWNPSSSITDADINNRVRRQVFSTAMIQDQMIDCCCEREPASQDNPGQVVAVRPANNAVLDLSASDEPPNSFSVVFNKTLNAETVTTKSFRVRAATPGVNPRLLRGKVTYNPQTNTATFTPSGKQLSSLLETGTAVEVTTTVHGSGSDFILDRDNLALDGNGDGIPGGDFTSRFEIRTARDQ